MSIYLDDLIETLEAELKKDVCSFANWKRPVVSYRKMLQAR